MAKKLITLKEATKFLKLNEKLMLSMIDAGIFTGTKSGRSYKVDKSEIEEWLANLTENEEEQLALRRTICRFQDYFRSSNVILDFEADNKYEAIAEMSKFAKELKIVRDHRWLYEVVVAREELVSTAVGKGVAFLHPRHMHPNKIKTPSIIYGTCPAGVDFDAPDNKPVKHFFMLLLHNDKQHLFSLSYLSKFIMNKDNLKKLADCSDSEEILDLMADY